MTIKQKLIIGSVALPAVMNAATLEATFQGLGPVAFAPAGVVAHDGSFDFFDTGSAASSELRTLAETGSPAGLLGTAPMSANSIVLAGATMPPIGVGGSATGVFDVTAGNNYVSLASMLLPSSDYFIGNNSATALDISSLLSGAIGTTLTFNFLNAYDAGTEVNDFLTSPGGGLVGAPAGMTAAAGGDLVENGVITLVTDPFGSFLNAGSFDTSTLDFSGGPIASLTLTVVPEPSTSLLAGLSLLSLAARRRR